MAKAASGFTLLLFLLALPCLFAGANPFENGSAQPRKETVEKRKPSGAADTYRTFLLRITLLQQKLKIKMTGLIKDFQSGKSIFPLLSVLAISFLYGLLHAAGPGHGKSFAAAYILSEKPRALRGLALGNLIAFFHGISGAITVLALHFFLANTVSGTVSEIEHVTKITSYCLLCFLGGLLVVKSLADLFSRKLKRQEAFTKNILLWAFSAGIVPCPGVVMIMLFCLSFGLPFLGVALSLFVSAGMAATISLVVMAVTLGKQASFRFLSDEAIETGEMVLSLLSGLFVLTLGAVFLLAASTYGPSVF